MSKCRFMRKNVFAKEIEKDRHVRLRVLFVCGQNKSRSPTAERLYQYDERIEVRSAGMSPKSPHPLTAADIQWAGLILVMEGNHKSWITGKFRHLELPRIENLDVPDEYEYMDEELINNI
jgi:predicted protein tyrosine phosphatase